MFLINHIFTPDSTLDKVHFEPIYPSDNLFLTILGLDKFFMCLYQEQFLTVKYVFLKI